ncbi:MAG: tetratricopeptide repeat protein [Alphaproteobacteria bacterium]
MRTTSLFRSFAVRAVLPVLLLSAPDAANAQQASPEMPIPEADAPIPAISFDDAVAAFKAGEHEAALAALKPLAEDGNALAQNALGYMYRRGLGADKDMLQSMFWYRKAAIQGNAVAQYSLGEITRKEGQTKVQLAAALEWITKAAKQNYADAQYTLGMILFQGDVIPQDLPEAYFWLALGSQNAHQKSARLLAHIETLLDEDDKLEQDQRLEDWQPKQP